MLRPLAAQSRNIDQAGYSPNKKVGFRPLCAFAELSIVRASIKMQDKLNAQRRQPKATRPARNSMAKQHLWPLARRLANPEHSTEQSLGPRDCKASICWTRPQRRASSRACGTKVSFDPVAVATAGAETRQEELLCLLSGPCDFAPLRLCAFARDIFCFSANSFTASEAYPMARHGERQSCCWPRMLHEYSGLNPPAALRASRWKEFPDARDLR